MNTSEFKALTIDEQQEINGGGLGVIIVGGLITIGICWAVDSVVKKTTGKSVAEHVVDALGIE